MATEEDLQEPLAITKREGEIVNPASGHFDSTAYETSPGELKKFQGALNVPPETVEYSGETKNTQAANNVDAEAMKNTVINVNVETPEGERFLGSPSAVHVSIKETCRVSKDSEPEEVTVKDGNEILEHKNQVQNNTDMEVAGEIGTEENKVIEDSEEKPDENNMSHDIVNLTGTSLQTTQVEESNIMIEEESLKEGRIIDHVEVVGDQHVLVEEKSNEKEKSDPHNYEKDGTMTDGKTDLASNEQVVNVLEVKSDHNKDDLIHEPDPTVISLNKSVETVMEPCNKAETIIEGECGEETRETSSTEVQNKEPEKSNNLANEVPEATKPSERVADEKDEKEESMYKGTEDTVMTTTDIQSNVEATLNITEGDNEILDKPSVSLATDVSGVYEAESEAAEKLKENSSILCEEKSKDETEPSKDEMNHKNSIDAPAMQTEVKDIINENSHEVKGQIEKTEKTAENDSTSSDQKGDGLFMKDEDALSVNEVLPTKEASSSGNRHEEESTVTVAKDSITDKETIEAFKLSRSGITNHEDRPEDLQQDKPENEKLEGSLNIAAEELNKDAETEYAEAITSVKEETPIKSHEENLEKEMKSDLPHHTDADVAEIELNEKTECAEVEVPNKNANDLHDIQVLDEEEGLIEGKDLDGVFNSEPKGTSQEAYTGEEKHIEDAPEACQSSNSTIVEHTSIEGAESTELIPKASEKDTEKPKEASGLDFEEKSVIMDDGENTDLKMQKNREACDAMTQEILGNSVDVETSDKVDNAVFLRDEKAEENPLELAPELTCQDESCMAADNDTRSSTNEEGNDRTKTTGSIVAIDEQVTAGSIRQISPESIEKPNVESSEGNKNKAEQSEVGNNREQVTEDNSIRCLGLESVKQGPVKNLEEDSTGEISEKSDTSQVTESVEHETIRNTESPKEIVDASMVKGDTLQTEGRNLTSTEPMAEENGDEFDPAEVKDDIENKTSKFEQDLEHISQKNKPGEKLPQSLSMISDKNEAFNAEADRTLGDVEEGPTQNLEEVLQIEEEKATEVKNNTKDRTATEDLEKVAETSDSGKSIESMFSKPSSEMDKMVVEEEIKKEESEEIYENPNDGGKDEETGKLNMKEECRTTDISQEPTGEETLQISKEDEKEEETPKVQEEDDEKETIEVEKNVEQSREVEEEKIERSSQEDDKVAEILKLGNDTYISPLSREVEEKKIEPSSKEEEKVVEISNQGNDIDQETLENSKGNVNKEKSEGEKNGQQSIEENNSRGLIPESESVEQIPVKNLEADKMEADKSTGESFETSETSGTAEPGSNEHERSTTIGSIVEVLDTSQMKQGDGLRKEDNQLAAIEPLAEDKRDEDKGPSMMADENSENDLLSEKDNVETKPPIRQEDSQHIRQQNEPEENHEQSLTVRSDENEAFIPNVDKTPCLMEVLTSQDLNEAPWREDNDKEPEEKTNQIPRKENPELVAEPSDASKSTESIVSELKSEKDQMLVQDEIKKEEPEELYDESKNPSLREPTEDKTPQCFEEEVKEGDTPITEVCAEVEISVGEDANKQITKGISVEQSEELEVDKVEQISKEDDITAKTTKQEECEIIQTANEDADTGSQKIEKEGADGNKFELFARGIDIDDPLVKESEENERDKQALEAETSSTSIEKLEIEKHSKQGASSSLGEEENLEENSKEDESSVMKLKDQDLEKISETSDARKSKESNFKPSSDTDKMMVEDEIKKEESEELYEEPNVGGKDEETEKHNIKEECSPTDNLSEPTGEESLESSKEDKKEEETPEIQASEEHKTTSASEDAEEQTRKVEKNVDQSKQFEEVEIEQSSQEDVMVTEMAKQSNDTSISPVSDEQETLETSAGNKDKEEKSVEESHSRGLIPESVEHSLVKNFEDDKMREEKSSGEIFENSKTSVVAEIAANGTSATFENTTEINDTSLLKQVDSVQNEEKNVTATESSAKEKRNEDRCLVMLAEENSNDNEPITAEDSTEKKSSIGEEDLRHIQRENEPEEKHERLLFVMSSENEAFRSDTDKTPCFMKAETSQDLDEAPQKEDNDKETEEKNDTEDNKIATKENHEIVVESSDASKSREVLELKSKEDKMLVHDDIKEEESKELYEDTKNTDRCNTVDIVKHSKEDASSSLVEEGNVEENSKEDESTPIKSKYQVDESNSFIEDTEASSSAEEKVPETLKDGEESKVNSSPLDITKESDAETLPEETNGSLIEESARLLHTLNKETENVIEEKEGIAVENLDAAPITVVTEEKSLQEAEPEDKRQVKRFAPAFEEKKIAEIETKETMLESVDINLKPDDTSDLGEKRDNDIPTMADKAREITEGLIQESAMVSQTSNKETEEEIKETEETITEDSDSASGAVVTEAEGLREAESEDKRQVESFGPAFKEKGIAETETEERTMKSVDLNVKHEETSDLDKNRDREIPKVADEATETIDCEIQNEAPGAGSEYQSEETTEVSESVHKPPAQNEVPFENTETTCIAQAKDETFMNKKDNTTNPVNVSALVSEDNRKEIENEEVHKHKTKDLDSAKDLSTSGDVEITKGEETGELADQGDICKSTTLKDFESSNLELQKEKTEDEKPLGETLKTSETSGICTTSEKVILEQEIFKDNLEEVVEVEDASIKQKREALTEELEVAETQTESDKTQIEEKCSNNQNQADDKKIKAKEELQLEAEEHKEQNVSETTNAVILIEKKQDGVEQSKNIITADQAPSAEKSNSQLPTPTSVNEIQYKELSVETSEEVTASTNIGRHASAEDRCIEDSHQVSVENMNTKESFPAEFERKEVGDSAIKLDPKCLEEESNYGSGKVETTTPVDEGLRMEVSQKESIKGFAIDRKIIQETRESEQSPCAATEKQIPTEGDLIEPPHTMVQTGNKYAPTLEQQGTTETLQKAEVGEIEPGNTEVIPSEAKLNLEGDQTTKESALMDSAKASLCDLLQRSKHGTAEVAKDVSEGREPTASTEENQTKEPEAIHVEERKMYEEQEANVHKGIDSSSDAPVIVEASRDVDVKVAHKKSHNILSGVGSKVKHSISKVKKAITGKSSHPKPVSPK